MSREIKFRAWDIEAKKMRQIIMGLRFALHGLIACEWCDGATLNNHWLQNNADCVGGKDRFVLMQFTGLLDKNNVEIYGSDIVEFAGEGGSEYEVVYDDDVAAFAIHNWDTSTHTFFYELSQEDTLKVIGNIHQNPG